MSAAEFSITPLAAGHDRSRFSCGSPTLDRYLQQQASQDVKRRTASCYVLAEIATSTTAGFYTLSATSLLLAQLPEAMLRKLPRHPLVPAVLLGRLAVATSFQRRKLGASLLADAAMRVARAEIAAFALVTDPKDEAARQFYLKHGFAALPGTDRLFTPVDSIAGFFNRQSFTSPPTPA